jgi:hypothetical protein
MITPNEKEHVIIQPDDQINGIIHQMITPDQMANVVIQSDDNINFIIAR